MTKIPLYKYYPESDFNTELDVHVISQKSHYEDYNAHRHGYYELFFFRQGGGKHTIDFIDLPIADLSIHAVSPGQVHRLQHSDTCKGKYIVFSQEVVKDILGAKHLQQFALLNNNSHPISLQLSTHLFDELDSMVTSLTDNLDNAAISRSWLQLILTYTDREFHKSFPAKFEYVKNHEYQLFKQLLEYNYHEQQAVSWYAEKLSVSEKKLNLLTKDITGETPSALIQHRILLEAKRLILHSSSSLKEIAYDLGFNDPAYFSRFIKKQLGQSPTELRNA